MVCSQLQLLGSCAGDHLAGCGTWDALFGKGNIPAFGVASGFALIGGIVGLFIPPKISKHQFRAISGGGN
jgi:solute carrier family 45 protein 1/2/4